MGINRRESRRAGAFTLTELVAIVAILIVVVLLMPALVPRRHYHGVNCVNNLKQIGLSFHTWALDNNDQFPMQVAASNGGTRERVGEGRVFPHFLVMSNELSTPKLLICPLEPSGARQPATVFAGPAAQLSYPLPVSGYRPLTNDASVSYFIAVDVTKDLPSQVLAGDRTLSDAGRQLPPGLNRFGTNASPAWTKASHAVERKGTGCLLMVDGSAQDSRKPELFFCGTNLPIRLAVP